MRKALLAVLVSGLFLLMLSALIVTPEDAAAEPPAPVSPMAALIPAPTSVPLYDHADGVSARWQSDRALPLCAFASALLLLCAALSHDANGRVLTTPRYENSFYQVFRAEVAGG